MVSRNAGNPATVDISVGIGYICGRRYKQISDITGQSFTGSSDATYYIRAQYTLSTNAFSIITELASSPSSNSKSAKCFNIASASWNTLTSQWNDDFSDMRLSNTNLAIPVTFNGTDTDPILNVKQDGTGLVLKVIGNTCGGDVQFFDTTNPRTVRVYGTSTSGLTIYEDSGTPRSVPLSCDNSNRLLISNDVKAINDYFRTGPIILTGTTIQDHRKLS